MGASAARMLLGLASLLAATAPQGQPPARARLVDDADFADRLSPAQEAEIAWQAQRNIAHLLRRGVVTPPGAIAATAADLQWPLQPVAGYDAPDYHGTKFFVDHDPDFPGSVQDYTCGSRTYDLDTGYNHAGTDYFLWPFPWLMMDAGLVQVVAAAPGVIAAKADGNFDRSCAIGNSGNPNFVRVLQDDGLSAIYLHLRSGSVTNLPVGARVAAGDVLGTVGSSGSSSGPHLHFELRDANGSVVDPRHGQCNAATERWLVPQPYEDARIVRLSTHAAAAQFIDCGVVNGAAVDETPNLADAFAAGDEVWVLAAFADQRIGQVTHFSILRPDGSTFAQWDFDLASENPPNAFYAATALQWPYTLPADAPPGVWQVQAQLQGRSYLHDFSVTANVRVDWARAGQARAQAGADATRCRAVAGSLQPQCRP